jgi:hypothetical protein
MFRTLREPRDADLLAFPLTTAVVDGAVADEA